MSAYSVCTRVPNLGAFDRHLCTRAPSVGESRSFSLPGLAFHCSRPTCLGFAFFLRSMWAPHSIATWSSETIQQRKLYVEYFIWDLLITRGYLLCLHITTLISKCDNKRVRDQVFWGALYFISKLQKLTLNIIKEIEYLHLRWLQSK